MKPTIRTFYQDEDENLDYEFHFEDSLQAGETILTKEIVQKPEGLTVTNLTESGGVVRCFLAGGNTNRMYLVTCRITTSVTPRKYDRSMYLRIEHK